MVWHDIIIPITGKTEASKVATALLRQFKCRFFRVLRMLKNQIRAKIYFYAEIDTPTL